MEQDNRQHRLNGRHALRQITTDRRCQDCGWATVGDAVGIRRTAAGVVGFAGLATCGRIWLCPVCNSKVMARRALEIGLAVAWAQAQGYHLIFGSLTVRHHARSNLIELLELQRRAWRDVVSSRLWRSASATTTVDHVHGDRCDLSCDRKRDVLLVDSAGRVGYIRASELTIGFNGWHPHFHPLIVYRGTAAAAQAFADSIVAEWVHAVEAQGGEARAIGGQKLSVVADRAAFEAVSDYVVKQTYDASASLALELVWSQNKTSRGSRPRAAKTQPHWALLAEIALDRRTGALNEATERWYQLEDAIPGHRMITWSRGLRSFAGVGDEIDDETIAAEEVGTRDDTVCYLTPDGWMSIRDRPEVLGLVLSVLETDGWDGLRRLLDSLAIEYFTLVAAN